MHRSNEIMKRIKRTAYFDCFCGVSGDMVLAAMLDAGLDKGRLLKSLSALKIGGVQLKVRKTTRGDIKGTRVDVVPRKTAPRARNLADLKRIIEKSTIGDDAKRKSVAALKALARAEAKVHGIAVKKVHFHELGAVDTIVDIVGAVLGLELLGVDDVRCSPVSLGSGTVRCAHGVFPVPAPATAELLKGLPVRQTGEDREITTPTGAVLMRTLCSRFGPMPAMAVSHIGYGAGANPGNKGGRPNMLRLFIGEHPAGAETDEVFILSANIDDATPEVCGHALERFLAEGALDAWAAPVVMKKGRPAWTLSVMCTPEVVEQMEDIFFRETSTFGVRRQPAGRTKLERKTAKVKTRWGTVRVKIGLLDGKVVSASPEYDDCRTLAAGHGVALRRVYEESLLCNSRKNK